jgi:hypothetical protein
MDKKYTNVCFNLPNYLGNASTVGAGIDQSLEWCLSNHGDIPQIFFSSAQHPYRLCWPFLGNKDDNTDMSKVYCLPALRVGPISTFLICLYGVAL